jgi:hypothetical protein
MNTDNDNNGKRYESAMKGRISGESGKRAVAEGWHVDK